MADNSTHPGTYGGALTEFRWWLAEKEDAPTDQSQVHSRVTALCQYLRNKQDLRTQHYLLYGRIYSNLRFLGYGPNSYSQTAGIEDSQITLNVSQNMCDSVVSRISKNKPKATVTTSGADFGLQRRAKNLEGFLGGLFYKTEFRKKAVGALRDACIFGTGVLKPYVNEDNEIEVERVPPRAIVVDDTEAFEGHPRNLLERRYVDRQVVIETFARNKDGSLNEDIADIIKRCRHEVEGLDTFTVDNSSDQILVTEGWHLPSGKHSKDGRRVIVIANCTLVDEPYEHMTFPHLFVRFGEMQGGFFGQGLVARLIGVQREINKLLRQIQQAHQLCAWPRIFVKRGSKVVKAHLNNEIGGIVEYDDVPPQQASFPVVPQEVYNHLKFLIQQAYEISGISQLEATSQKPAGVESGIALRTLQDVQSVRFTELGEAWEELHADAAKAFIRLCAEISKHDSSFAMAALNRDELGHYTWADAEMDEEDYQLQIFPTSSLPDEPAGKLQWVEDLSRAGNIDPEDAFDLIDFPDTKQYSRRRRAGRDVIDRSLERILYEGEYTSPEPFDNLTYALRRAQETYDIGRLQQAPPENLDLLQRYMLAAQALLSNSQQAGQMQGAPPPAAPPPPGPPPGAPPQA